MIFLYILLFTTSSIGAENAQKVYFHLNNGNLMPAVGIGTFRLNGPKMHEVLDYALKAGYRLIDTAALYLNEVDVGEALKKLLPKHNLTREDVWITTKLPPFEHGALAYQSLKNSLRRLRTDYVDLYLIHWPGSFVMNNLFFMNNSRLRDESWKQLVRAQKEGLARNLGVANYLPRHLEELLGNDHGVKPVVNQVEWHPHFHSADLKSLCNHNNILIQAFGSLGGTGNKNLLSNQVVVDVAKKLQKSPAQILLRWALQQSIAVIPKASSRERIKENLELGFEIPEEDMHKLSGLEEGRRYNFSPEIVQ